MPATERLGWRDEKLSQRHRDWGFDCPATDIDFLLVEYHQQLPVALVEYKFANRLVPISTPSVKAVGELATLAGLPFFIARYDPDTWEFYVIAANKCAQVLAPITSTMSEKEWVKLLYRLRGVELPARVLAKLKDLSWTYDADEDIGSETENTIVAL